MIFDSHMHTEFSEDSKMKIEDAIKKSKENNIGIILTEHLDLDQPEGIGFRYDIDQYFNQYGKYRDNSLLLGTELGLSLSTILENTSISKNNPYDYIIGSIHSVYEKDIYSHFGKLDIDKSEMFNIYFDCMYDCIKSCNYFDSLGHIDYLCRYVNYSDKELKLNEYKDRIEAIFTLLILKDKVLELNTKRLNNQISLEHLLEIYRFYKELGGKYVTIGSDAHNARDIYNNFDIALKFVDSIGLEPIYFKNRKPEFF